MKYLKITNKGELDVRLIFLMGATTKSNDEAKIGKFGTGLKYAISYFLRNGIDFRLFSGEEEIIFNLEENIIHDNTFQEIYCNGKSMNITTHYGHQWKAWEAIRELWCNAKDEGEEKIIKTKNEAVIEGKQGATTFYIEATTDTNKVFNNWTDYFLKNTPIFENENVAIYPNNGEDLKIYKNGVLIEDNKTYKSLFLYDLKKAELNELRQYRGYLRSEIGEALLQSNKEVAAVLIDAIKDEKQKDIYEIKLDWDYLSYKKEIVKKMFSGYLYLHPDSDTTLSGRSIKVNISLFNLLTKAGLPTEKIKKAMGGYYGGGGLGFSDIREAKFKEIEIPELREKIQAILTAYNVDKKFIIATPKKGNFEIVIEYSRIIFSSDLENFSQKDLKATVLIAAFHSQSGNMYKALKRLIKFVMNTSYFSKLLFGKEVELIEDKPTEDEVVF